MASLGVDDMDWHRLRGISHLAPHAHVLALKNKDFSRNADVVARIPG